MKKIALLILFSFAFGETFYSDKVVSLYLDESIKSPQGRLLPTNGAKVLEKKGDLVKLEISGFVNPASPYVVYTSATKRIFVAAFSKNTKIDYKILEKGNFNKVSFTAWAKNSGFVTENETMMKRANQLFTENCGICHKLHDINEFNANQWPSTFKSMASRTGIDKSDRWLVIQYLQKTTKK